MAVGYSLHHVQAASLGEDPLVWVDVPGAVNWEPSVSADTENIMADGVVYAQPRGNRVGEGDLTWIDDILALRAMFNGGEVSTSGTTPQVIERYEMFGESVAPPFALSDWVPNVDKIHDPTVAGTRTTAPSVTAGPVTRTSGQESTQELTAATSFLQDANGVMEIVEKLESSPVFTDGVMPVNMTAPTTP